MSSKNSLAISEDWEDVDDPERWTDIFENNDLKRRVISKSGQTNDEVLINSEGSSQNLGLIKPRNGDLVKIKVFGTFTAKDDSGSKQEIDKFDELEFELGLHDVIEAWELAVKLMVKGEIDEIRCSPRFAYGNHGREPDIPPNTCILYTIELLSFEPGLNTFDMPQQHLVNYCEKRKERGNYYFKREEYDRALAVYNKGVIAAETSDIAPNYPDDLRVNLIALYNNIAVIALKFNNWSEVLDATEKCLLLDPKNPKSLYRRAKAFQGRQEYENALELYEKIVELQYDLKDVKLEIIRCKENLKRDKERMKKMCGRMIFGKVDTKQESSQEQVPNYLKKTGYAALAGFAAVGATLAYRFLSKN